MSTAPQLPLHRSSDVCARHGALEDSLGRIERTVTAGFDGINKTLKEVASDLRDGAVDIGAMKIRIALLERLVFGAVGTALTAIVLGVLALILKR